MINQEARAVFSKIIKDRNFMTPHIINYGFTKGYVWELSQGEGLTGNKIFGLTVANSVTKKPEFDLSKCFDKVSEATFYSHNL